MLYAYQLGWIKVEANTDLSLLQRTHQFTLCLIFFSLYDGFTELTRLHTYLGSSASLQMGVGTQPDSGF